MTTPDPERPWNALHDATPPGWFVGRPGYVERYNRWEQAAFDSTERARVGKRSREWVAVGRSEVECVAEMARCLEVIGRGEWPK